MVKKIEGLKVIMIVDDYPPLICGVGDYSACLSKELVSKGVKVTIATKQMPKLADCQDSDGVDIHRIVRGWFMSDVRHILALLDKMGSGTIVHVQYSSHSGYYRRLMINILPAIIRMTRARFPVVATIHGYHENRLRWRARAIPMIVAANVVILVNAQDYRMVTRWVRPSRFRTSLIKIASNIRPFEERGFDREEMRKHMGFNQNSRVIVYFGNIRPDKGVSELLRALRTIRSKGIGCNLLVISNIDAILDKKSHYYRQLLKVLNYAEKENWVTLVRAPEPNMVSRLLQISDLAVFPFTRGAYENSGSLLAAIAHGLPTITTRGISTPKNFEEDYGVETVPVGDHLSLVSRISSLLHSPEAQKELKKRALTVSRNYSWDTIANKTISVYKSLL